MKVNEYVRTKYGISQYKYYKVIGSDDILGVPVKDGSRSIFANKEDIIKSSPNITNLIEAGDVIKLEYDGNEYICDVYEYKGKANCLVVYCEDTIIPVKTTDERVELKSVVTHEQFSQMEYRIGE